MTTIRIDFDNPGIPQYLDVMEDDSQSRFFAAELYRDGAPYRAPSGATYSIMYRGPGPQNQGWYDTVADPDGNRVACSVSGNVVTCEIAPQALHVPGRVTIVLCITGSNGYMLKGWPIECNCQSDRYDDTADVTSYFYVTRVTNATWAKAIQALELINSTIDASLAPYVTAARAAAEQAARNEHSAGLSRDAAAKSAENSQNSANLAEESQKKTAAIIARMENINGGYCTAYDMSISVNAWMISDKIMTDAGYLYQATVDDPIANPELEPNATVAQESAQIAMDAEMAWVCKTEQNQITFWAKNKPTADIQLHMVLFGQGATLPDTPTVSTTAILGRAVLGQMTLGGS